MNSLKETKNKSADKEQQFELFVSGIEDLLKIVSDLTHVGYKISLCRLRNYSYGQCARKFGISKRHAQFLFEKCKRLGYDKKLKELFNIP